MAEAPSVRLVVVDEDGDAAAERVTTLPVTLGRDAASVDVAVLDRMVSRRHARLEADGASVVVVDLDSGNGTWVAGAQIRRRALAPGEDIVLGSSTVRWSWVNDAPPPAPELGTAWVIVVGDRGLRHLPLAELRAAWDRAAGTAEAIPARGGTDDRTLLDALTRESAALDALLHDEVAELAAWTLAAGAPDGDPGAFRVALAAWRARPEHHRARAAAALLRDRPDTSGPDPTLRLVVAEQRRAGARVAAALRDGRAVFASHGPLVIPDGVEELAAALRAILASLLERDRAIVVHARAAGLEPAAASAAPAATATPVAAPRRLQ